jgi:hypothetical protein
MPNSSVQPADLATPETTELHLDFSAGRATCSNGAPPEAHKKENPEPWELPLRIRATPSQTHVFESMRMPGVPGARRGTHLLAG